MACRAILDHFGDRLRALVGTPRSRGTQEEEEFDRFKWGTLNELLVLPFEPKETYTRESFRIGVNQGLFPVLCGPDNLWLYGDPAVGKTHAMHILVTELECAVLVTDSDYELLGLEAFTTVVLDGIEQWLGDTEKEKSVFGLHEQLLRSQHRLILTSRSNFAALDFELPDLRSRVSLFSRYHMLPLPPTEQPGFIQDLGAGYGVTVSAEVVRFLLRHLTRSQEGLVEAMARLNQESIVRKRTISVQLVKEVFEV